MTDWLPQSHPGLLFFSPFPSLRLESQLLVFIPASLAATMGGPRTQLWPKRYRDESARGSRASGKDAAAWWKGQAWKSHSFTGITPLPFVSPPLNVCVISGAGTAIWWLWGHKHENKISTLRMAESASLLNWSGTAYLHLFLVNEII